MKLAILAVLAISIPAGDADACKMATPAPFKPVAQPGDQTPPSAPMVTSSIKEPTAWVFGACNTWCTANGVIDLMVSSTDDRGGQVGYEVTLVGERPFPFVYLPRDPVIADDGRLWLIYDDGGGTLELDVRAIDQSGNRSAPTRIEIEVPRHIYWGRYVGLAIVMLPVAIVLVVRRRRRSRR